MPRQGRMQSGTGVYHDMMRGIHFHLLLHAKDDTVGNIVKRIASSYVYYFNRKYGRDRHHFKERFRSEPCEDWADFFPLCNVNAVLGRISMDELTALVDTPLDNDVCCIDNPCSPAKKTRRCQTVAKADRNRQKQNIKCIKKIIIADRTVSCYRVLGSEHIFPRVFFRYTDMCL